MIMGDAWLLGRYHATVSPFCIDEHEVTVAEYAECVRRLQCAAPAPYAHPDRKWTSCNWNVPNRDDHPINCVNWEQAHTYCRALGKDLPTEAQWELAARGGPSRSRWEYPWGDRFPTDADACWNLSNMRRGTCPVGSFPSNAYGLRDMAGNVSEWVFDWYEEYPSEAVDYRGPARGQSRICRGGSWMIADPGFMKTSTRDDRPADYAGDNVGFRCATAPAS